jgi:hypothetical protein
MADTVYKAHGLKDFEGGIALKAAGLIAADTASAGVYLGRGTYLIRVVWTACEVASGDELYNITIEGNTSGATSTWKKLGGQLFLGANAVNGGDGDAPATGDEVFTVYNPGDYQVRVNTFVNGTIATGCNFSVTAYPAYQTPR